MQFLRCWLSLMLGANVYLGVIAYHEGDADEAEGYFKRALEVSESTEKREIIARSEILHLKALALLGLGKEQEAINSFQQYIAYDPPDENFDFIEYDLLSESPSPPPGLNKIRELLEEAIQINTA